MQSLELEVVNTAVEEAGTGAYKMLKQRRDDQVVMRLREEIDSFKQYLPLLQEVANPALLPRHWENIFKVGSPPPPPPPPPPPLPPSKAQLVPVLGTKI